MSHIPSPSCSRLHRVALPEQGLFAVQPRHSVQSVQSVQLRSVHRPSCRPAQQVYASVAGELAERWGTGTDRSGSFCEALLLPQVRAAGHVAACVAPSCSCCTGGRLGGQRARGGWLQPGATSAAPVPGRRKWRQQCHTRSAVLPVGSFLPVGPVFGALRSPVRCCCGVCNMRSQAHWSPCLQVHTLLCVPDTTLDYR